VGGLHDDVPPFDRINHFVTTRRVGTTLLAGAIGEIEGQPGIPARRSLLQLDALFSPVVLEHDVDRLDDDARPAPFSAGLLD
jgi:hypothetical protein